MFDRNQCWRFAAGNEPPWGDSLYWDRWAQRLALAAAGTATEPSRLESETADTTFTSRPKAQARSFRHRITANLERLTEELQEEAERLNEQAADLLLFTESA